MRRITQYPIEKISDLVKPGQKVLIEYECGLGDVIMFLPYYEEMKRLFPDVEFSLKTKNQDCFFDYNRNMEYYDWVFRCDSFFNEETPGLQKYTKPECNCVLQLGIPYNKELEYTVKLPHESSPFVGMSFCNSCFPERINCTYETAKMLWERVRTNGMVPIELFTPTYRQAWERPENKKFDFVDCTMRGMGPDLKRMLSLMATCRGHASVATGNFHYAMTLNPEKVLYIENKFSYKFFTNKNILSVNTLKPDMGVIEEWIQRLKA